MKTENSFSTFVGVDVAKDTLEFYLPYTKQNVSVKNTVEGIDELILQLKKKRKLMVVMEATGGYEKLLVNQEKNRLKQTWDDDVKRSIQETLETLNKQLKSIDTQLAKMIAIDTKNARKIEILDSAIGVGKVMTSAVLAQLPELGQMNRGQTAKLVGIAPINRDSGKSNGKRFIGGGRAYVRLITILNLPWQVVSPQRLLRFAERLHLIKNTRTKKPLNTGVMPRKIHAGSSCKLVIRKEFKMFFESAIANN